ncbi:MAG: hypothetical protein IT385_02515 [Deltaproteobacteria bacterium]|nr:hypothetical protein [Deltaproteobacteria bacterium]
MRASTALALALSLSACNDKPGPEAVDPADDGTTTAPDAPTDDAPPADAPPTDARRDGQGADPDPSGLWVEDADGTSVGLLVRRGSDDQIADRAIYDIVTVFHPPSGLFFEITMSDGKVRYPQNTFFSGYDCGEPMGVAVGACTECKAGYGAGFLHAGGWWRLRGGTTFETMAPGSLYKGGLSTECIAHGTSNAKGFAVQRVVDDAPPLTFAPPLRFVTR